MDENWQGYARTAHSPDDEEIQRSVAVGRLRDYPAFEYVSESRSDREVGRCRGYQQGFAQLQRCATDLRGFYEQQRVQIEEDLGKSFENGKGQSREIDDIKTENDKHIRAVSFVL